VGVSKTTVWRWKEYFVEAGVDGLVKGRSKPPGKKPISASNDPDFVKKVEDIVGLYLDPPEGACAVHRREVRHLTGRSPACP